MALPASSPSDPLPATAKQFSTVTMEFAPNRAITKAPLAPIDVFAKARQDLLAQDAPWVRVKLKLMRQNVAMMRLTLMPQEKAGRARHKDSADKSSAQFSLNKESLKEFFDGMEKIVQDNALSCSLFHYT